VDVIVLQNAHTQLHHAGKEEANALHLTLAGAETEVNTELQEGMSANEAPLARRDHVGISNSQPPVRR
jgi:hypothetical protein